MADNSFKVNKSLNLNPQTAASANPVSGDVYFDSTIGSFVYYNSSSWASLDAIGAVVSSADMTSSLFTAAKVQNSVIRLTGSGGNIHGLTASFSAKKLVIYNNTSGVVILKYQSATEVTANNRILTTTGGDLNLVAGEIGSFIYDVVQNRWLLVAVSSNAGASIVSTISNNGIVTLHAASATPSTPKVLTDGDFNAANGVVALDGNKVARIITLGASNEVGLKVTGDGAGDGIWATAGSTGIGLRAFGGADQPAIFASGATTGAGVDFTSTSSINTTRAYGAGIYAEALVSSGNGFGVVGVGKGIGAGGFFTGGSGGGAGVRGFGNDVGTGGEGGILTGTGNKSGAVITAGSTGFAAVAAYANGTSGIGVYSEGSALGGRFVATAGNSGGAEGYGKGVGYGIAGVAENVSVAGAAGTGVGGLGGTNSNGAVSADGGNGIGGLGGNATGSGRPGRGGHFQAGTGGNGNGSGIESLGTGSAAGVLSYGGSGGGTGVSGIGGAGSGIGVWGDGVGDVSNASAGVKGVGGTNDSNNNGPGAGVSPTAGPSNGGIFLGGAGTHGGDGIQCFGRGTSVGRSGGWFSGAYTTANGAAAGAGIYAQGGVPSGTNANGGHGIILQGGAATGTGVPGSGVETTTVGAGIGININASGTGLAIKVVKGDVQIPTTNNFKYATAQTRHKHFGATEANFNTATVFSGTALGGPTDPTVVPELRPANTGATSNTWAFPIKVPPGSLIIAVEILVRNNNGTAVALPNIIVLALPYFSTSAQHDTGYYLSYLNTNNESGVSSSTAANGDQFTWVDVPLAGNASGTPRSDDDMIFMKGGWPAVSATNLIAIVAVRVTFTQQTVTGYET